MSDKEEEKKVLKKASLKKEAEAALKRAKAVVKDTVVKTAAVATLVGAPTTTAAQELHVGANGVTYTPATTTTYAAPSQGGGGATASYQQQAVFNSLSPYAQQRVMDLGMQNRIITRYNSPTGLNRPEDGVIYSCAVPDPSRPGYVLFIPVEEALYRAGARNPTPIETISLPEKDAEIMMVHSTKTNFSPNRDGTTRVYNKNDNPFSIHTEYMVTLENGLRALRTENIMRDQIARERTRARTSGIRHANDEVNRWTHEARRVKQNVQNIGRIFRR